MTAAPVALPGGGRNGVRVGVETFCTTGTLSELDMLQVSGGADLEEDGPATFKAIAPGGAWRAGMSHRRAWAAALDGADRKMAAASRPAIRRFNPAAMRCSPLFREGMRARRSQQVKDGVSPKVLYVH